MTRSTGIASMGIGINVDVSSVRANELRIQEGVVQVDLGNETTSTRLTMGSWSNHGPRIVVSRYLTRFWEPPASRIFNQLPVNRVLSLRDQADLGANATAFGRGVHGCGGRI
jgi:hypothetical protein